MIQEQIEQGMFDENFGVTYSLKEIPVENTPIKIKWTMISAGSGSEEVTFTAGQSETNEDAVPFHIEYDGQRTFEIYAIDPEEGENLYVEYTPISSLEEIAQLEVDDTPYSLADLNARETKVSKSGDTLTGTLVLQQNLHSYSNTGTTYETFFQNKDKNNNLIGYTQGVVSNTTNGILNYAYNKTNAGTYSAGIYSTVDRTTGEGTNTAKGKSFIFGDSNTNTTNIQARISTGLYNILKVGGNSSSSSGAAIRLGSSGLTIIGAGEYDSERYALGDLADDKEDLYLGADETVHIEANGQTIADRKHFGFTNEGNLVVGNKELKGGGIYVWPEINIQNNVSNTTTVHITPRGVNLMDSDGVTQGRLTIRNCPNSTGNGVLLLSQRVMNGQPKYNSLTLGIKDDGSATVILNKDAWRTALGITNVENKALTWSNVSGKPTIRSDYSSSDTQRQSGHANLCTLTKLPKGIWIIQGSCTSSDNTTAKSISISTQSLTPQNQARQMATTSRYLNVTRIMNLTAAETDIFLVLACDVATNTGGYLYAIQVA